MTDDQLRSLLKASVSQAPPTDNLKYGFETRTITRISRKRKQIVSFVKSTAYALMVVIAVSFLALYFMQAQSEYLFYANLNDFVEIMLDTADYYEDW